MSRAEPIQGPPHLNASRFPPVSGRRSIKTASKSKAGSKFDSRVARAHCCARAPSEPDVRLSPHPAQASPEGVGLLIDAGPVAAVASRRRQWACMRRCVVRSSAGRPSRRRPCAAPWRWSCPLFPLLRVLWSRRSASSRERSTGGAAALLAKQQGRGHSAQWRTSCGAVRTQYRSRAGSSGDALPMTSLWRTIFVQAKRRR